ncbi:MAG: RNA methyltransferase [Acidobacteriota bacterium]
MKHTAEPPLVPISSRSSHWFRRFRKALEEHQREIVVEGPKQIRDSVALGWNPLAIAWDEGRQSSISSPAPQLQLEKSLFHELSTTRHSQGVLGLFERRRFTLDEVFDNSAGIAVILDSVQDPGNVGTIVRLAAAFDACGVVVAPGSADPLSQKAIRASAGAVLHIPVAHAGTAEILESLGNRKWPLFAATRVQDGATSHEVPQSQAAIVFGNEGAGVSPAFLERAMPLSVRTSSAVESLNVAAAAAILLWQSYERRTKEQVERVKA